MTRLPHPIPYQGSKRNLARAILGVVGELKFSALFEPFAGSAAISIAAANLHVAKRFVLGDTLAPLVSIWERILRDAGGLASEYERIWKRQENSDDGYFNRVRDRFNSTMDPAALLYLLARCVKNSPRFNKDGEFNQSHDRRRLGMKPAKMRRELFGAAALLAGKSDVRCADFSELLASANDKDLVYLDPPWEGTSVGRDRRYHAGLERERLINVLEDLNRRTIPYLLSYDGACGEKRYGDPLPERLALVRLELNAGRSSQATLNGRDDVTIESLYVSPALFARLKRKPSWAGGGQQLTYRQAGLCGQSPRQTLSVRTVHLSHGA